MDSLSKKDGDQLGLPGAGKPSEETEQVFTSDPRLALIPDLKLYSPP
jgi:hypothetical protein